MGSRRAERARIASVGLGHLDKAPLSLRARLCLAQTGTEALPMRPGIAFPRDSVLSEKTI